MLKSKYITPDEFKEWSGIDLGILKDDANPSNKKEIFLYRNEDRLAAIINTECFRNVDLEFPCLSEYQKLCYKKALLEQSLFVLKNGETSVDNGIDPEKGVVITAEAIANATLAPNAKRQLLQCGLWSKKIKFGDIFGRGSWL